MDFLTFGLNRPLKNAQVYLHSRHDLKVKWKKRIIWAHLAIVGVDHLLLQQLCQLTEENAVIQPVHQTVCCEVQAWEFSHSYCHCGFCQYSLTPKPTSLQEKKLLTLFSFLFLPKRMGDYNTSECKGDVKAEFSGGLFSDDKITRLKKRKEKNLKMRRSCFSGKGCPWVTCCSCHTLRPLPLPDIPALSVRHSFSRSWVIFHTLFSLLSLKSVPQLPHDEEAWRGPL